MRIRPVGAHALLLELPSEQVELWRRELWERRDRGEFVANEIVTGACTILLDGCADTTRLREQLSGWAPRPGSASAPAPLVRIPIEYAGEDLAFVAELFGGSVSDFVERHLATEFLVAFCGFAPGFAYMTGLDLPVPRLNSPRPRVPAGSVGLADTYCGIYPTASPGGWRLIGRTSVILFDPNSASPALLRPGTRVRFVRARS